MKLYNRTDLPDRLLERVLYHAAKNVGGVRTSGVVVLVKPTRSIWYSRSCAHRSMIYEWYAKGWTPKQCQARRDAGKNPLGRLIITDGGWIEIKLYINRDPFYGSMNFYEVAAHEWRHVKDYQRGVKFGDYHRLYRNRPHEKRAMQAASTAVRRIYKREGCNDAILELGIALEERQNQRKVQIEQRKCRRKEK